MIEYLIPVSQSVCLPIRFHLESKFYSGCGGLLRLGVLLVVDPLPLMDAGTHLGCRHSGQMAIHKMQNMMRHSVVIPKLFVASLCLLQGLVWFPIPNPIAFGSQMGAHLIRWGPVYSRVDAAKGNFVFVKILGSRSKHHCRLIICIIYFG